MHTSELLNALNPYATQSRPRNVYQAPPGLVDQPAQQYTPHRSELELAISEPPPPASAPRTRQPTPANLQAVHELLRIVATTRESHEIERKRRVAWEQEQEAKYTQRQAEMERQMLELRQEITSLRSLVNANANAPLPTPNSQYNMSPAMSVQQRPPQPASPVSPGFQSSPYAQPMFVEDSSNNSLDHQGQQSQHFQPQPRPEITISETSVPAVTPAPSPLHTFVEPSQLRPEGSTSPAAVNHKKRQTSDLSSDEEDQYNNSDSSASNKGRPLKRANHHDKRCLTINHAVRVHTVRLMGLEDDKQLPDSHPEGITLGPEDAVRFVWDKTTKQSVHNARMKARILADIKSNRKMYKHVPEKDFSKKTLDAAFEQSFITLRQKFKAQRDAATALALKKREDIKSRTARHLSRRKLKLSSRADARLKTDVFEHVVFDGALQLECMSSDESDVESSEAYPSGILRTRGCLWRSSRLTRFYCILDDEDKADRLTKPKRGVGRKGRYPGLPKEGFHLPPKGVATWMISKRWIKASQMRYADLSNVLSNLVDDPPGFNWDQFDVLGDESGEDELQTFQPQHSLTSQQHNSGSTSLLNYALV